VPYNVAHVAGGFGMMCGAGMVSGLLGAGSGVFKVLAMDTAMRLPMKVSTSTSNFMIGVTAAASAGIFFQRGDIDPTISAPVALGVLLGAMIGAKVLVRMPKAWVRKLFIPAIVLVAVSMLAHGAARGSDHQWSRPTERPAFALTRSARTAGNGPGATRHD